MKICYIVTSTINTGPINVLYNLLESLSRTYKRNFNPVILKLEDDTPQNKSMEFKFKELGINVIKISNIKKIENFIIDNKIDIIHSNGLKPDIVNLVLKYKLFNEKIFFCSTLHNYPFDDYIPLFGRMKGYIMSIIQMITAVNLYSIACSKSIQEKYNRFWWEHVDVVQNGVLFPMDYKIKKNRNKNKFVFVGELISRKNVCFLIEFFKKNPNLFLTIVGDGNKKNSLERDTINYQNIKFVGRVEDPSKYYLESDYFISASKAEGLPMAAMEAASYGLPLVLSDIDAHKELINNNGKLFKNNNLDSLKFAIENVQNSDFNVNELCKKNKLIYSSDIMAQNYWRIYQKIYE